MFGGQVKPTVEWKETDSDEVRNKRTDATVLTDEDMAISLGRRTLQNEHKNQVVSLNAEGRNSLAGELLLSIVRASSLSISFTSPLTPPLGGIKRWHVQFLSLSSTCRNIQTRARFMPPLPKTFPEQ